MDGRSLWRILLPLALIFLGIVLLCSNLGVAPGLWDFIAGLWPLALIGLGLAILLGWQAGWPWSGNVEMMPINEPLGNVRTATLELSGRVGELEIEAASANSQDLLGGKIPTHVRPEVDLAGDLAEVRLRSQKPVIWWPFGGSVGEWDLRLNPQVTWRMHVGGGGETDLDLTGLRVAELQLDGHVGSVQMRLPRFGRTHVKVGGRLGDLTLRIPEGVAARIHKPAGPLGSARVDTARFPLRGNFYESADFETAADRVEIELDSSLGDLRII